MKSARAFPRLKATFEKYGERVDFTKFDTTESVDFHTAYDIAMVPSLYSEGTSLSLLEAMSAGCACIATDVGGLSNIIINGHNGILIRPDAGDLRNATELLIKNKEKRLYLAENAKRTVLDSFTYEIWSERWNSFLATYFPAS